MAENSFDDYLDDVDLRILREVQENGRISNVELANRIQLSPPATHTRLKRLQQQGYIRHYAALLDAERMGFDMICFINISLQLHQAAELDGFRKHVRELPEVLECFHVTGEFDYLLKVVVRNRKELHQFVEKSLTPIPGVARIYTSLVMNELKNTTALPI